MIEPITKYNKMFMLEYSSEYCRPETIDQSSNRKNPGSCQKLEKIIQDHNSDKITIKNKMMDKINKNTKTNKNN